MVTSLVLLWLCALGACSARAPQLQQAPSRVSTDQGWANHLQPLEPSKQLARLEGLIGQWDVVLEDLTQGAGSQARELARGSATIQSTLGGRYLAWDAELELGTRVVLAHGRLGFDSSLDAFQFLWISELAPGMRIASGRGDAKRGGLVLEIAEVDRESGALMRARSVVKITSRNFFSLTQMGLDPESGAWIELQRTRYERRAIDAGLANPDEAPREG